MYLYTLRVYPEGYGKSVFRLLKICGTDTLDILCQTILSAFEFDNDHLYEYCLDNQFPSSLPTIRLEPEPGSTGTEQCTIDHLTLSEEQKITLHYDFGHHWLFTIRVKNIEETDHYKAPACIRSVGRIEQYENHWGF